MKLERMLSIVIYLLNHEKVTAQELAEKFEVSVRTIYRDIEAISQAGIPIGTFQGAGGGISIVEGYKLDRSVLTSDEVLKIVAGLRGLYSISEDLKIKLLIEKLTNIAGQSGYVPTGNEILIDLSSWNKNDQLGSRIQEIKQAIRERRIIEFRYCSNEKLTERRVEPCQIIFKQANWYLYGYCLLRKDFRLFKLRRMTGLTITDTGFEPREFYIDRLSWDGESDSDKHLPIVLLFDESMVYAVNDIFGMDNYEIAPDGRLKVTFQMELSGWLYGFILGFGDKIEVVEPAELQDRIKSMAESICKVYEKN